MNFIYEPERIYAQDPSGKLLAELTFPINNGVATMNHTFVDRSLRGQGVAGALMEAGVQHLRDKGLKARPTCSYAVTWFSEHPEEGDILLPSPNN
jgi:hypothetical protein